MAIKVTVSNMTSRTFSVDWSMNAEKYLKTINQAPSKTMIPYGKEALLIDQSVLSWYVSGNMDCDMKFGLQREDDPRLSTDFIKINIHVPLHFLSIGAHPRWGYFSMAGSQDVNKDDDKVQAASKTVLVEPKLQVLFFPTISHSDLTLGVTFKVPQQ